MELKTSVSNRMTSLKKLLISAIMVTITAMLIATMFSGCVKKEEIPMEATRQLVIPSELEPDAILQNIGGENVEECIYEVGSNTDTCPNVQFFAKLDELKNGFIKGCGRYYTIYVLRSGEQIGIHYHVIRIVILKYEFDEAAQEAINKFSEKLDLKSLIFDGVKIKGIETKRGYPGPTYMLQSNTFVIFLDGNLEACRDAVSRIIELYSVPKDNNY